MPRWTRGGVDEGFNGDVGDGGEAEGDGGGRSGGWGQVDARAVDAVGEEVADLEGITAGGEAHVDLLG